MLQPFLQQRTGGVQLLHDMMCMSWWCRGIAYAQRPRTRQCITWASFSNKFLHLSIGTPRTSCQCCI